MTYDDRERVTQGSDVAYYASVECNPTDPILIAFFTMKVNLADADPGVLQKRVTSANVIGTGQIVDSGSGDGTASIRFDLTATDLSGLSPQTYFFDVKGYTSTNAAFYAAQGLFTVTQNVTTSTS